MGDILSQDEIDALLSAVTTGEIAAGEGQEVKEDRKVSVYDFKRPEIFSKEQMRTLQMLHDTFSKEFTSTLSAQMRMNARVSLVSVDQLTYGEYIMTLPSPGYINLFTMKPLEGNALVELNPGTAFAIIDRVMGGTGDTPKIGRELTFIEQSVLRNLIEFGLKNLKRAWEHVGAFEFDITETETNPQFAQIVAHAETVVAITFEINLGTQTGVMSFCFPYLLIEPVAPRLSAQQWIAAKSAKAEDTTVDLIKDSLNGVNLDCAVELGETILNVKDIIELKAGDIIRLDGKIANGAKMLVENNEKFVVQPGRRGRKSAVQILSQ